MALFFLVVALLAACWGVVTYWLAETHTNPSQTSLIPQFLASIVVFVVALICAAVSIIITVIGG